MYSFVIDQIHNFTNYSHLTKPNTLLTPSNETLPNNRNQEFYDSFLQNHHNMKGFSRFKFFSEKVGIPFVGWLPSESYSPEKLTPLLMALADSDRKFLEGEFQSVCYSVL